MVKGVVVTARILMIHGSVFLSVHDRLLVNKIDGNEYLCKPEWTEVVDCPQIDKKIIVHEKYTEFLYHRPH